MKISTKGRYALEVVIDLALKSGDQKPQSLKDISRRRGLSEKYLERIMKMLRKGGIILSTRGTQGGYCLSRPADKITVLEVLNAAEGELEPVQCLTQQTECGIDCEKCPTRTLWAEIWHIIRDTAASLTVSDLIMEIQRDENKN